MAMALRDWTWLPEATRQALRRALQRAVEEGMPLVPSAVQAQASAEELLAKPSPHQHLHNIPLIAQAALATAAEVIDHPERQRPSSGGGQPGLRRFSRVRLSVFFQTPGCKS